MSLAEKEEPMPVLARTMLLSALTVSAGGKTPGPVPKLVTPAPVVEAADFEESLRCLALNIYHEARSESEAGQMAVAAVTLNRMRSESFPDSVCGVVKQGGERRHRCQFSWWCDGKSDRPVNAGAWETALSVGRKCLLGRAEDPTHGALYYHANYVKPRWAGRLQRTAHIGNHLFYRPKSEDSSLQLASLADSSRETRRKGPEGESL